MRKLTAALSALLMLTAWGCTGSVPADSDTSEGMEAPGQESEETFEEVTEPVTEAPTEPPPGAAELKLEEMNLHEKVCQMFIVTPEQLTGYDTVTYSDQWVTTCYEAFPVGGFILFSQNIWESDQLAALTGGLQDTAMSTGIGAFISVDEEGGTLTRVQAQLGTEYVNDMVYYGELGDSDAAFDAGAAIGSYLSDYGFNLDFAPVADVNISPANELGSRIFSSDPEVVAQMSAAVSEGLQSEGVLSTLKHFPGLGAGDGNTHYGSVWIDRSLEELQENEFTAFRGGIEAGADFVMVGHQITSGAEDGLPGDLSRKVVTDWLREELGFAGLAITDSHSMGAVTNNYTSADAAVMAVQAGIDVILMPYDTAAAIYGIEAAVEEGTVSEERIDESVLKILEKKESLGLLE